MAVYHGNLILVRILESLGADLNAPDVDQHAPIAVAYYKGTNFLIWKANFRLL